MTHATILVGFILLGSSMGFFALLIFRMSIHQRQFNWTGPVATVTALAGGGFVTFLSSPLHFAMYSIGFFLGMALYLAYLYLQSKGHFAIHLSGGQQSDPVLIASAIVMCRDKNPKRPIYFQPRNWSHYRHPEVVSHSPEWQPKEETLRFLADYQHHVRDDLELRLFLEDFLRRYGTTKQKVSNKADAGDGK